MFFISAKILFTDHLPVNYVTEAYKALDSVALLLNLKLDYFLII